MKKIAIYLMAASLSLTFLPIASIASNSGAATGVVDPVTPVTPEVNALLLRMNGIKEMDKSNLSGAEKKELRKELRSLKHELKKTNKGVYLSIGAIIIIVLVLILIL